MIIPFTRRRPWPAPIVMALAAALGGSCVAWHYHRLGLTLSHYDARGHLVVARRIADSITPGWQQIGAVWLPLPHLLNAIPVQADLLYRTGASAVAISIASYAIAAGAIGWILLMVTASVVAAVAGAVVFALNPNVLYLQSTPMTEPLLLATTTGAVAMLIAWCRAGSDNARPELVDQPPRFALPRSAAALAKAEGRGDPRSWFDGRLRAEAGIPPALPAKARLTTSGNYVGVALALACLTRYEAWPVTVAALAAAAWARWRSGQPFPAVARDIAGIAVYPALAITGFVIFSRVVIGEWFVSGGFFVPENTALGDPVMAAAEIGWGTRMLSGTPLTSLGAAGMAIALILGLARRRCADLLIVVALLAMAAIPWTAFLDGHPFRIRYMVPLMAVEAIGAGLAAGILPGRAVRTACASALLVLAAYELRPLDASAPMVVEAQWDRPNRPVRARVTACLGRPQHGDKIMASMGSLGHYMQEASAAGFAIRDFLHEGNGDLWLAALTGPRPFVRWVLIEEKAEGGDMLAHIARENASFLDGYQRVCEGAGLALYRRD